MPEAKSPDTSDPSSQPTPPKGATKRGLLQALGPGLITGAADDDPSGIATYSQVGAQYGYGMLWVMLVALPLMIGIQEISAQIGRVTGHGIAGNLRRHYHPAWLFIIVSLVIIANVINLGADLGAMGDAVSLLVGGPTLIYCVMFAIVSILLETFMSYEKYASVLKWLCVSLFAYVATVFAAHVNWSQALHATVIPRISSKADYITSIVAVLGTTISPYLFFWQAQEEVEIEKAAPAEHPLKIAPAQAKTQLQRIRTDTVIGMTVSNLIAYFIILTTASTLHIHSITDIQTSTQAAEALRPFAGRFAFFLFAIGIIGTGLLALPVFAGSAAYAVGEALRWRVGLNQVPKKAIPFYSVIAVSMLVGLGLNFLHINPIKALFWSAVINGVIAVPIMFLMMFMARNKDIMGKFTIGKRDIILGWLATFAMLAAAIGLFATWGK